MPDCPLGAWLSFRCRTAG